MDDPKSYWQKQEKPLFKDLEWNFPEQKSDTISIIGGNSQNFSNIIRTSEFVKNNFPFKTVQTVLPESLRTKFPTVFPDIIFSSATPSGSFEKSELLNQTVKKSNFALILGDLSKNATTAIAIAEAIKSSETPIIITRDSVDLLCPEMAELLTRDRLFLIASLAQLQKVFRAVYYPKVLLLSMPLLPVVEILHKFTISYKVTILTLHQNQIIVANNGKIITTPLEIAQYNPLSLWNGTLAAKIAAMNLWNPGKPLEATTAAILS